jgi:hypothetical protein
VTDLPDYYAILGLPPTASRDEIRAAYRRLARRHHPDVNPSQEDDVAATELMRRLNAAYEVLNNPTRRAAYDRQRWAQVDPHRRSSTSYTGPTWSPPPGESRGTQTGGGRWRPPKSQQVVYEQPLPGWLESFFIVEGHLKERLRPLATRLAILVPFIGFSALLVVALWAYNDITNDPNAMGFLTCVINAFGGIWVFVGVVGVVVLFVLGAWYVVWRSFNL